MMLLLRIFSFKKRELCQDELAKPFAKRAIDAIKRDDLPKAVAYLTKGIQVAPNKLKLYLQRAQINQYGLNNFSSALQDYRYILRKLEQQPNDQMALQCKQAMKDMMEVHSNG